MQTDKNGVNDHNSKDTLICTDTNIDCIDNNTVSNNKEGINNNNKEGINNNDKDKDNKESNNKDNNNKDKESNNNKDKDNKSTIYNKDKDNKPTIYNITNPPNPNSNNAKRIKQSEDIIYKYNGEYNPTINSILMGNDIVYESIKLPEDIYMYTRDEIRVYNCLRDMLREMKMNDKKEIISDDYIGVYKNVIDKHIGRNAGLIKNYMSGIRVFLKKIGSLCVRELRRGLSRTSKTNPYLKGRKIGKELNQYLKRSSKCQIDNTKKMERIKYEKRKREQDEKEAERQKRKLNFLINQTEIFSYFMKNKDKLKKENDSLKDGEINNMSVDNKILNGEEEIGDVGYNAALKQLEHNLLFSTKHKISNKKYFKCKLMEHQEQGLKWLISLYDQGINGILADDMGLGKTVQTIAFLTHLMENEGIEGPFLIVTPASTIGNWKSEIRKFTDDIKVVEYYGNLTERKNLRKKYLTKYTEINIVITSYQIVVADEKTLQKLRWQYMVLDEAQAIKSSSSIRWKVLLRMNCRNRLLLTGTPIQNNMQELWSLLHFIMPTLFDSHEEFSEWFSKDIENSRVDNKQLNIQLTRLHSILKPFMLRREKKDINLNIKKIEKDIMVEMSNRQKKLYYRIEKECKVNIEDINDNILYVDYNEEKDAPQGSQLQNTVMQLRKVCNHPDLFQRLEIETPLNFTMITNYQDEIRKAVENKPLNNKCYNYNIDNKCYNYNSNYNIDNNKEYNSNNSNYNIDNNYNNNIDKYIRYNSKRKNNNINYNNNINFISNIKLNKERIDNKYAIINKEKIDIKEDNRLNVQFMPKILRVDEEYMQGNKNYFIIPRLDRFISDSGKLVVLDRLLPLLRSEGHKILMYFQMTRMIDLVEDYLICRKYSYVRLDGGVRVGLRRDIVKKFQEDDIFIFLLSTRAGGVGINLTAADTVIFYDSDWNPTVDQQAMDRAHRLGQTKDVTVYRLITKQTVEERVIIRAQQKGEIQKLVIEGGEFKHDL